MNYTIYGFYLLNVKYLIAYLFILYLFLYFTELIEGMEGKFFGQHLAEISMQKSLKSFFKHKPQKALVMSFNGLTGSGKNFLTNIIANSTYKEGMNSKFVHLYNGMRDFPHKKKVSEYQVIETFT